MGTKGLSEIYVISARVGKTRSELGTAKGTGQREKPSQKPNEKDGPGREEILGDEARGDKDPDADRTPDDQHDRVKEAQFSV